ncbi:SLATT domain-containing protein [Methanosarcina siciliae]|uniref:SLATT domain-containing protein n=1 Tax=Methanosarcina siciliae TaxID=38027 RepID=UPI00064F1585|nr:SLATT domain-containing protein [Methanosarcina siciliae]
MSLEHTVKQIKKIRVDALLGKKKHFNAADRKEKVNNIVGAIIVILNIFTGSVFFYLIFENDTDFAKYIGAFIAFTGALLVAVREYFNLCPQIDGHRTVASSYLDLAKKCDRINSYILDGVLSENQIIEKIEELSLEIAEINLAANSFPTNKSDYVKSLKGFQAGEELYTEEELNT